ncbi:MAG: hypothetical protein FWB90_00630 [Fibromonadales bacterium]|nr:hypothetical protein [Fibromonadales bacterium]
MKKIIWALFQSETKFPEFDGYETYSFGIGGGTDHIHMDLSTPECIKELEKYPKPDVIFASPPCESWIVVSVGSIQKYSKEKGRNLHWKNKWEAFDFYPNAKRIRVNGVNTATTTGKIIQHFNPDLWAIENGNTSWIFDYIKDFTKLSGYKNKCNYYAYSFDVLKPTIIYSNLKLCLNKRKVDKLLRNVTDSGVGSKKLYKKKVAAGIKAIYNYKERSKVPPDLYRHILQQFELGGQPTLFPLEETA